MAAPTAQDALSRTTLEALIKGLHKPLARVEEHKITPEVIDAVLREVNRQGHLIVVNPDMGKKSAAAIVEDPERLRDQKQDELWELWGRIKETTPVRRIYLKFGEQVLRNGDPLWAHDVFTEALRRWPDDASLIQQDALALARCGATEEAQEILQRLTARELKVGQAGEETLGILARTYKDRGAGEEDGGEAQREQWTLALEHYLQAFRQARAANNWYSLTYNGINAATMSRVLGRGLDDPVQPGEQAERSISPTTVRDVVEAVVEGCGEQVQDYWTLAIRAEARLILDDLEAARRRYSEAIAIKSGNYGDLTTTARNARFLLRALGRPEEALDDLFRVPDVMVFAGHTIGKRFKPQMEQQVRDAIAKKIRQKKVGFGFSSAAAGSDILFIEEMLRLRNEVTVVLAYPEEAFLRHCVRPGWRRRFQAICRSKYVRLVPLDERNTRAADEALEHASLVLSGLAQIRARSLGVDVIPVAVWDGKPGRRDGGTAAMVDYWYGRGSGVDVIKIDTGDVSVRRLRHPQSRGTIKPPIITDDVSARMEVAALLFADVKSFSRLDDEQAPRFMRRFIQEVAGVALTSEHPPLARNTWGDGLHFVFKSVNDAGVFALELRDALNRQQWRWLRRKGADDLKLRIALHAGPVFRHFDPILNLQSYFGTHVNMGARLEPVTKPGEVWATQAFAALVAASQVTAFSCEYRGLIPLAKNAGVVPAYRLRR